MPDSTRTERDHNGLALSLDEFADRFIEPARKRIRRIRPYARAYRDWLAEEATEGRVGTPQKYAAFKAGWTAALDAVMQSEDYKKYYAG